MAQTRVTRTSRGRQARRIARELASYVPQTGAFASAVGISRDTARSWMSGRVPARPRVLVLDRISRLLRVCVAADRYFADRTSTGRWLVAKNDGLLRLSPAKVVLLHGTEGVQVLRQAMPYLMPRMPARPVDVPTMEELQLALDAAMAPRDMIRGDGPSGVTFSDQELDDELAEWDAAVSEPRFVELDGRAVQNERSPSHAELAHIGATPAG